MNISYNKMCVFCALYLEKFKDEVPSQGADFLRHVVLVILDPSISVLEGLALKRKFANQQGV